MIYEIEKKDWVNSKAANINLIIQSKMQIEMAEKMILLCDEKIKEIEDLKEQELAKEE